MGRRNIVTVDLDGLARQWAHKSKDFIPKELISNACDMPGTTLVTVDIQPVPNSRQYAIKVVDNHPGGVADLDVLTVMFVDSEKKDKATVSGRFNLGEKLVLAFSQYFRLETTTGGIEVYKDDLKRLRTKRDIGTSVECHVQMTREQADQIIRDLRLTLIPRKGQKIVVNGYEVPERVPVSVARAEKLPCPLAKTMYDDMELVKRDTGVEIYIPKDGETPMLYELGIPVCPSESQYHYNVLQKVPLPWDRDSVSAGYLRSLHAICLNVMAARMNEDDMRATWAKNATEDDRCDTTTVKTYMEKKHGENAVRYDPSDPESARRAAAENRPVIYGGSESSKTWDKATEAGATPKSSVFYPTPKAYQAGGKEATELAESELTSGMKDFRNFAFFLAKELMGVTLRVVFIKDRNPSASACYFRASHEVHFFVGNLGRGWFDNSARQEVLDLLFDEFGHEYESNHLSENYYRALRKLGAKCTMLALQKPELFKKYMPKG